MAEYTENLNLKKPDGSEDFSIGDFNSNFQAIDNYAGTNNDFKKQWDGTWTITSATADLNAGYQQMPPGMIRVGANVQHSPTAGIMLNLTGSIYNAQLIFANTQLNQPVIRTRAFRSTDETITADWHYIPTSEQPVGADGSTYIRPGSSYNNSFTVSTTSGYRGVVFLYNSSTAGGAFMIGHTSQGTYAIPLGTPPSSITVTTLSDGIRFTNTLAMACYPMILNISKVPSAMTFSTTT